MKKLFFIWVIIIPFLLKAQDCKFLQDEKDEFTGEMRIQTRPARVTAGMFEKMLLNFRKVGSTYILGMEYTPATGVIREGDELIFKMVDSTFVKAKAISTTPSTTTYSSGYVANWISCHFNISKSEIQKLTQQPIQKIRFNTVRNYYDVDVNEKNADNFIKIATCILSK